MFGPRHLRGIELTREMGPVRLQGGTDQRRNGSIQMGRVAPEQARGLLVQPGIVAFQKPLQRGLTGGSRFILAGGACVRRTLR